MGGMQDSGQTVLMKRTWVDKGEMDESRSATSGSSACLRECRWCLGHVVRGGRGSSW